MKYLIIALLISWMFILSSCASTKSECPTIPTYPGAQSLGYIQLSSAQRTSSYSSKDTSEQIINYYAEHLRASEWNVEDNTTQKFSALYTSINERPPFLLEIVFRNVQPNETKFDVYLTISGPYSGFESWCTQVKP